MLNCAAYKITIVDVSSQWETQGEWFCNEPSQRQNLKMSFLCKWWSLAHRYWERLRELGREAPAFDAFCHKTFSKRIQWKLSVVKRLNDLWIRLTLHFSVSLKVDFFLLMSCKWCGKHFSSKTAVKMWNLGAIQSLLRAELGKVSVCLNAWRGKKEEH